MSSLSFLYIAQTATVLPSIYDCLRKKEFILLSYKESTPDTKIFLPKSTWTTGRNALREYIIGLEKKYDYYVFLDEDMVFSEYSQEEGFNKLEELVDKYRPTIANPNFVEYYKKNIIHGVEAQTTVWYDGMCNIFSKDTLFSNKIFPYIDKFDNQSWWTSQYIMIILCSIYKLDIVLFNNLKIINTNHNYYPNGISCFKDAEQYVFNNLINKTIYQDCANWDNKNFRIYVTNSNKE